MIDDRNMAREKLGRLGDALSHDVDELSNEALFREAEEHFGDPQKAIAAVRSIIGAAVAAHGNQRLVAARRGYSALTGKVQSKVVTLPLEKKRALIERFAHDDPALQEKLTMAARNEDNHAADIDTFLEDLVELGVVDEEGNVL